MCANSFSCAIGLENCCVAHPKDCDHSNRGGVRTCKGQPDPRLELVGSTEMPATTLTADEKLKVCENSCATSQHQEKESAVCHQVLPIEHSSMCVVGCLGYPTSSFKKCALDACVKPFARHFGKIPNKELSSENADDADASTGKDVTTSSNSTTAEDCKLPPNPI